MVKKTIKPENNDRKCFQYAIYSALIYKQIKSHPKRISEIKIFINQYDWKKKDFLLHKNTGKSLNQVIIPLLLMSYKYLKIM